MAAPYFNSNNTTIQHIYERANEDVPMRDEFVPADVYLVVDTNILLHHLRLLRQFSEDVQRHEFPVTVVIPNVVISELDGLKKDNKVLWEARTASTWLLEKVKGSRKYVRVQARQETVHLDPVDLMRRNDLLIYDCCLYFKTKGSVALLSADTLLCVECGKDGENGPEIEVVTPPRHGLSSRELAHRLLYARGYDVNRIMLGATATAVQDDDAMDIDDGPLSTSVLDKELLYVHPLDTLHLQVVDHFGILVRDLAGRVRAGMSRVPPVSQSIHAPAYRRKRFEEWGVGECLEFLGAQKTLRGSRPPLGRFLLRPHSKDERGWRNGRDWSRQDWSNSLDALQELGVKFEDGAVLDSVEELKPELQRMFS